MNPIELQRSLRQLRLGGMAEVLLAIVDAGAGARRLAAIKRVWPELAADPARSENLCMRGTSRRENREIPWLPVRVIAGRAAQGRLRP